MSRYALLALALLAPLVVAGCYEDVTPTRYEAGVYKGKTDPLLEKLESGDLRDQLDQRFEIAATDR